jgi:hypothetical protein
VGCPYITSGTFYGYVKVLLEGGINLYYKWDDPFGGHCCDEMRLISQDEMHVTTHLMVGVDSCTYRVVYWRAGTNGSGEDPPPPTSSAPLLMSNFIRSASKMALQQMQGALSNGMILDSKAIAHQALTRGGRRGGIADGSDSEGSDREAHGSHRVSAGGAVLDRRSSTDGKLPQRKVRPFARVEEL